MAGTHRVPTTVALIVCLLGGPSVGSVLAADDQPASIAHPPFTFNGDMLAANRPADAVRAQAWQGTFNFVPDDSSAFAQRHGFRRGHRGGSGAITAVVLGAAASIAGAAVLVYANRPECRSGRGEGCGYGTKVVGGAVLSAGLVGVIVGAVTWR